MVTLSDIEEPKAKICQLEATVVRHSNIIVTIQVVGKWIIGIVGTIAVGLILHALTATASANSLMKNNIHPPQVDNRSWWSMGN